MFVYGRSTMDLEPLAAARLCLELMSRDIQFLVTPEIIYDDCGGVHKVFSIDAEDDPNLPNNVLWTSRRAIR